jgi:hypothetical protein
MQTIGTTEVKVKSVGKPPPKNATRSKPKATDTLSLKPHEKAESLSTEHLTHMIATAAYYCAERRQFEPGRELEDWLTAEREVRATLAA